MKRHIKRLLLRSRISLLASNSSILRLFYHLFWKPKEGSIDEIIDQFSKSIKDASLTFIQVGSNDGFQNDPICKFIKRDNWKGALVEPQKVVLPTLSKIYNKNNVEVMGVAISEKVETRTLYKLQISEQRWATGLSSFVKQHIQDQIDSGYVASKIQKYGLSINQPESEWIGEEAVQCTTFEHILSTRYFHNGVDLLVIDTEGFDFEILKLFPFSGVKPKMVIYEAANLSDDDLEKSKALLTNAGYSLEAFPPDIVAKRL